MPPRRIYVDLDDVLCETTRRLAELVQREFGRRVRFDEIRSFDLGQSFGLDATELEAFMRAVHRPEVLGGLEPRRGAVEAVAGWAAAGYEIAVVTGRPPSSREVSREWLERCGVPHHALWCVDKYARRDPDGEGEPALELAELARHDFALAVEDSPGMASFLAERAVPVALLDRPWNRGLETGSAIVRCRSWAEVVASFPRP